MLQSFSRLSLPTRLMWGSLFCVTASSAFAEQMSPRDYAKRLFHRVTGTPLLESDTELATMDRLITAGDLKGAVRVATGHSNFYELTLRNWVAPLSTKEGAVNATFNDMQAMIIGTVKDNTDAREILTGNYTYAGFDDLNLPPPDVSNNDHYKEFESRGFALNRNLQRVEPQWPRMPEFAGVLTSRAWGAAHYLDGTNRRAVQYAMQDFLCAPIEQWKDNNTIDIFVRRDVDRRPAGDPADYQNRCRSCHGPMDAMGGAFARFDFANQTLVYTGSHMVARKFNRNATVYPAGNPTSDDSWVNLAVRNQNAALGWTGALQGRGINAFGQMLANSDAFAQCMVKRVFKEICKRPATANEAGFIENATQEFKDKGYGLKDLFEDIATSEVCIPRNT